MEKIIFATPKHESFTEEVKAQVAAYFEAHKLSSKANATVVIRTVVLLAATSAAYFLILLGHLSGLQNLGLCFFLGVAVAGIGFGISHDALHGAYSSRNWVNDVLGWTFELCGASGYMWKITHNVIHHTYTNIPGVDEDLDVSPLLRLSPEAEWKWYHRYQKFYFLFLYAQTMLFWVFVKDYKYFLQKDIGPYKNKVHPMREVIGLLVSKLFFYTYMFVIPIVMLHLPWWQYVVGYSAIYLTAGIILGIVFQLAHVVEETTQPTPDSGGHLDQAWMIHEMATTANFACKNSWLSWYLGGLNFQVEHHLFSKVCSVHYPQIHPLVRSIAHQHGVPYNEAPTFRQAVKSHIHMLDRLGKPPLKVVSA